MLLLYTSEREKVLSKIRSLAFTPFYTLKLFIISCIDPQKRIISVRDTYFYKDSSQKGFLLKKKQLGFCPLLGENMLLFPFILIEKTNGIASRRRNFCVFLKYI